MKREGIHHPKVKALARRLNITQAHAVGILEMLWHWTRHYAIQGDVGRRTNSEIADGAGWKTVQNCNDEKSYTQQKDVESDIFVDILVEIGFLDRARKPHRLVIHDIKEHADNSWRQCLEDAGLTWWDGSSPRRDRVGRPTGIKTPASGIKTPVKHQEISTKRHSQSQSQSQSHKEEQGGCSNPEPQCANAAEPTLPPPSSPLSINTHEPPPPAYEAFVAAFRGPIPDGTPQAWARHVGSTELAEACARNTPLWMQAKPYNDGFHDAIYYLRHGAWRRPPPELGDIRTQVQPRRGMERTAEIYLRRKGRLP